MKQRFTHTHECKKTNWFFVHCALKLFHTHITQINERIFADRTVVNSSEHFIRSFFYFSFSRMQRNIFNMYIVHIL